MLAEFSTNHERYLLFKSLRDKHLVPEGFKRKYPKETELILKMTLAESRSRPKTESIKAEINNLLSGLEKSP